MVDADHVMAVGQAGRGDPGAFWKLFALTFGIAITLAAVGQEFAPRPAWGRWAVVCLEVGSYLVAVLVGVIVRRRLTAARAAKRVAFLLGLVPLVVRAFLVAAALLAGR